MITAKFCKRYTYTTKFGCVSVTFASSNEEINVILHLHRRCVQAKQKNIYLYLTKNN